GLSSGRYRVKMYLPKKEYAAGCSGSENAIKVKDFYTGQIIGWRGEFESAPNHDYVTNVVWVGEAEISSADVSFNNQGYNPNAFDSGQVVRVNITSDYKWTGWRGVIRDEQTLEEYETGWQNVNNNTGPFY